MGRPIRLDAGLMMDRVSISGVASRHFGKFADVWKHLTLLEVLAHEHPVGSAETHAGSAVYPMVDDAERGFGVRHFVEAAVHQQELAQSRYLELVGPFLARANPVYPGSATLAMRALGKDVRYLFCDLDERSATGLRGWAHRLGANLAEVAHADGMSTTARWLGVGDGVRTVVHVDPFDPHAKGDLGQSALSSPPRSSSRAIRSSIGTATASREMRPGHTTRLLD